MCWRTGFPADPQDAPDSRKEGIYFTSHKCVMSEQRCVLGVNQKGRRDGKEERKAEALTGMMICLRLCSVLETYRRMDYLFMTVRVDIVARYEAVLVGAGHLWWCTI